MPTYSYRCTECGNEFDVRQSFSDEPLKVCEACGGSLRKLFNSSSRARASITTMRGPPLARSTRRIRKGAKLLIRPDRGPGRGRALKTGMRARIRGTQTRIHETRARKPGVQTPAEQPVRREPPHRRTPPLRQPSLHRSVTKQARPRASAAREAPPLRKSARLRRIRAHSSYGRIPRPQARLFRERRRRTSS